MCNIQYKVLSENDIEISIFDGFNRFQDVRKCWRKVDNQWLLKDVVFTERWGNKEFESLVVYLKKTVRSGGFVSGAFEVERLVGFVSLENTFFGPIDEYLQLSSIHISYESRGLGIGTKLFEMACAKAREIKAKKLYISAHSSEETQAFYKKLGCIEAKYYNQMLVDEEPFDCQLEYLL